MQLVAPNRFRCPASSPQAAAVAKSASAPASRLYRNQSQPITGNPHSLPSGAATSFIAHEHVNRASGRAVPARIPHPTSKSIPRPPGGTELKIPGR